MSLIPAKILLVSQTVGHIEKNGETTFGSKYKYQAWDDVQPAVRDACIQHDLAIAVSAGVPVHIRTESDKPISKVQVPLKFTLMAGDETMSFDYFGECLDIDDKAVQKAITNGFKYWLLKTFMIACEGVEDSDSTGPDNSQKQNKAETAKKSNTVADERAQLITDMTLKFKGWGGTRPVFEKAKADLEPKNRDIYDAIKECSTLEGFLTYVESVDVKK